MKIIVKKKVWLALALSLMLVAGIMAPAGADVPGLSHTYTLDADFDLGSLNNVVHVPSDQLQLSEETEPFNIIWVAVSGKGTVVKINTQTGQILGEYRTAPSGMGLNPSRTTVDASGHVWVTNRNEQGWVTANAIAPGVPPADQMMGSVTYIGSPDTLWIDRNDNGVCDTSSGFGDVKAWTNAGGADTLGGTSTAEDECIIHYVRVHSYGARHVSVDANNDVWVSGTGYRNFDLIDSETGNITRQEKSVGYGGYGGLIDGNGVIWSARNLLRWDTALALTGPNSVNWTGYNHDSYGLGIDSNGYVWNTSLSGNAIRKFAPDGTLVGTYSHGDNNAQGCVAGLDDDIWVAHTLYAGKNTVGHILNDGTFIGNVLLDDPSTPAQPTGVAVDGDGYIWATGYNTQKVYKIDPNGGPIGADGVTHVGSVNWTSPALGGFLYNYSDMTGSTISAPPNNGTWTIVHDSTVDNVEWGYVSWTAYTPGDSSIVVTAASSNDGVTFGTPETVTNGTDLTVANGRYLRVVVTFSRSSEGGSPILYDLTITANQPPDCSDAYADPGCLWPPNHKFVDISIMGVTDPDLDPVTITVTGVTSDEPTASDKGSGGAKHAPDAIINPDGTVSVRAERSGDEDGRVYEISFTASDGRGGECEGTVIVKVPHDQSGEDCPAVDSGQFYDATDIN